ncbi:MAG: Ni/Fe-hydrogenase cytochrome b subunit [Candidatus Hydrogenedentes bacterium]|nr:Ni/Fe-hydrogenase cytochrome b subunit [Candidatus Hydrogenedentota bacterium]
MSAHGLAAAPVNRKFFTPGVGVLMVLAAIAGGLALYRFVFGLASMTNLDDRYPWGLWIAVDVATGVALAAGGFTSAALTHIFHRGRYLPVVRPALLTAMLGYTFVGLGLMVDLGRYYNIWHPAWPTMWQGNSVLFEVGMCVMAYLTVLYIEFLPIVCEWSRKGGRLWGPLAVFQNPVKRFLEVAERTLSKTMVVFIIAGVVLSCMHQSSLGALMLIAPYKVHPLWYTPILPLLFLLSAIAVGFPMVIFESMVSAKSFRREPEMHVLTPLSRLALLFLGIYMAAKITDLMVRNAYGHLWDGSFASTMFMVEVGAGVLLPFCMLLSGRVRRSPSWLFIANTLIVLGVALNRINVYIVAYQPHYATHRYVPSIGEILITLGLIATLMLVYRVFVTIFPVLPAVEGDALPALGRRAEG